MSEQPRKSPEVAPEVGPEGPGSRLLTMPAIAEVLGVSERAARDWAKRHDLPIVGRRPVRVSESAVRAAMVAEGRRPRKPPEVTPEVFGSAPEGPGSGDPIEAAYQVAGDGQPGAVLVPLQTMVEELRGLAGELARLAERNEALALEVGGLRAEVAGHQGQLVAKDETIAAIKAERDELRRRAEAAEDEIAAIRTRYELARRGEKESDHRLSDALAQQLHPPAAESSPRNEGLRARLGRWWRGED